MTGEEEEPDVADRRVVNFIGGPVHGSVVQLGDVVGGLVLSGPAAEADPLPSVRDVPHFEPEPPGKWWQRKRNGKSVADPGPDGAAIAKTLLTAFEPREALSLLNLVEQLHAMDQEARDRATSSWRSVYQAKAERLLEETGQHPGTWRPDAVASAKEIISGA